MSHQNPEMTSLNIEMTVAIMPSTSASSLDGYSPDLHRLAHSCFLGKKLRMIDDDIIPPYAITL